MYVKMFVPSISLLIFDLVLFYPLILEQPHSLAFSKKTMFIIYTH